MRSCSPSRYSVSTVSSVRQTSPRILISIRREAVHRILREPRILACGLSPSRSRNSVVSSAEAAVASSG
jgi:hypothetical protein